MSRTSAEVAASPSVVWSVLSDPRTFQYFVVGSRTVRRFDPDWPDVGSTIHHTVGLGPLSIRDSSTVIENECEHKLVLEARFRPLGVATVGFLLEPTDDGTELTIDEEPSGGLLAKPSLAPWAKVLLLARNHEVLRRIRRLAESRLETRARFGARFGETLPGELPGTKAE